MARRNGVEYTTVAARQDTVARVYKLIANRVLKGQKHVSVTSLYDTAMKIYLDNAELEESLENKKV